MKKSILSVAAVAAMVFNVASPIMTSGAQAQTTSDYACGDSVLDDYELSYIEGDTVTKTLREEIDGLYVGKGADVTIDMNGFAISQAYGGVYEYDETGPYIPTYLSICVDEGGKLTLRGEGYIEEDIVNMGSMFINGRIVADDPLRNYGEAVIDEFILNNRSLINGYSESGTIGKLTINGGQFNRGKFLDLDISNDSRSELTINGGVFGADDTDTMIHNRGTLKVTNGKFISQSGAPIIENYSNSANAVQPESSAADSSSDFKPQLYVSGGEFEANPGYGSEEISMMANFQGQELDFEPVGQCSDIEGNAIDNTNCVTQISGGYYRYFIPNSDFFVEGYRDYEVDADTVQVRGVPAEPAAPEEPKEEVENPDTFDGLTGLISALSISFISGFGLVNFLKHRR